ncbi:TorD/DmsD family molecular chaperone [Raoultibacter phocaeensis]|uniref:TorD/DmsD family molecular chaperone n=1 Tax=Raoultibacter phocaeensis TaxID=2479841 RepID=UPI001119E1A7|nr:molecular chaperone TorD family protein [Raoultibacter phocaeensis]
MAESEKNQAEGCTSADLRTWAVAYELLALSLRYPTLELAEAVASGEWAEAAAEVAGALGLVLPDGWDEGLDEYAGWNPEALLHALRAEATRLFVGAPEPAVSPYEGVQRAADDGVQALLFVNPHSMAVERFMRSCGLGRPEGTNEPLDRVDTELEFLQYLCMLEAGMAAAPGSAEPPARSETAGGPDTPAGRALGNPAGSWAATHKRFLEEHALTWMPRFADRVAEEAREPFYRVAAGLLKAVLEKA